ncbi:MAG: PEP-CTERM sorting domain-containing protein [Lachnospiraceae bacterium]|jgi:cbb3-type cytochrome oxidase subunit 3
MEPKTIIGIGLVLFIIAGLVFMYIRNKRKK